MRKDLLSVLTILIGALACSGCLGSSFSRLHPNADWAGAYPGQAIATDALLVADPPKRVIFGNVIYPIMGILSLPLDIVIDTILLPVDLVAWPFGCAKGPLQEQYGGGP